jgi:hypothetical protein
MAKVKKEVTVCDICENETKGFNYWEVKRSPFGIISESSLVIDICEDCARIIENNISENMMIKRGENKKVKKEEISSEIKKWKRLILERKFK